MAVVDKTTSVKRKSNKHSMPQTDQATLRRLIPYTEHRAIWGKQPERFKKWYEQLKTEAILWAKEKRVTEDEYCSYTVEEFYVLLDIPEERWCEWQREDPDFKLIVEQMTRILGMAREARGLREKDNVTMITRVQWHYSKIWEKAIEVTSKATQGNAGSGSPVVQMIASPNTDVVPERKNESANN